MMASAHSVYPIMYSTYYVVDPEERWYQSGYNKNQKFRDDRRPQNDRGASAGGTSSHTVRYNTIPRFTHHNSQRNWVTSRNQNANGKYRRNSPQPDRREVSNPPAKTGVSSVSKKPHKTIPKPQQQQSDEQKRDDPKKSEAGGNSNDVEPVKRTANQDGTNGNKVRGRQFYHSSYNKQYQNGYGGKQWAKAYDAPNSPAPACQHQVNYSTWPRSETRGAQELSLLPRYEWTPMCRCIKMIPSMIVTEPPDNLTNGTEWDNVSLHIWSIFIEKQQCEPILTTKIQLWGTLYRLIKRCQKIFSRPDAYAKCGIYLVGSTLSGFGMDESDVDLCFMLHHLQVDQRTDAQVHLSNLKKLIVNNSSNCESDHLYFPTRDLTVINAKVPLLTFKEMRSGFSFDINCNNAVGIRNTHLLYHYGKIEWRVRPLVILVKTWARYHGINDAKSMTLSSYSLTLMVIHFLQCGVSPAVLPCLQKMFVDRFNPDTKLSSLATIGAITTFKSRNTLSLGELLVRFLNYYSAFDFSANAISVRLGCTITAESCRQAQTPKNEPSQWKYICIEEPYDQTNTARAVHEPMNFQRIVNVIKWSAKRLAETKDLASIFERPSW